MSRKYKFYNPNGIYFVSFSIVNWIDVFTRRIYKDILVDSINYCIDSKGLDVYAWVIMSNHIHLLVSTQNSLLENIIRDLKKFTAKAIIQAIEENEQESRKEWILQTFKYMGKRNSNNSNYQFWQQHNQPEEITTEAYNIDKIIEYIHENPVKTGFVNRAEDYPYSSAIDFAGEKGLINLKAIS